MTLSEIQQSFYSRRFDVAAVETWLLGVAVIALFILGFLLFRAIKARRNKYVPHGEIVDVKEIREIMRSAFDQRRPFEVQVQTDAGQRRPTLRCSPDRMGNDSFIVEINGLKTLSDRWLGRKVAVFFRVMSGKDFTYYTFPSSIIKIDVRRRGVCLITLPMPDALENRQKRAFLRMAPPREYFKGAAVWHEETMPPPEKINEITQWPRPKLLAIPNRVEQFFIIDLSAGGARLRIPHSVVSEQQLVFNAGEHLIIMLDLYDPEMEKRLRYWLQCRIQNVWVEQPSRDTHMGLQCIGWARPKEQADHTTPPGSIEWLRLSKASEVEPLGNWIMRRHLELFRESPLES